MQPLGYDERGVIRFKENKIVTFLLDNGGYDMNKLARFDFSREDRVQFAQLIGYSLHGFGELGYVSDADYDAADKMRPVAAQAAPEPAPGEGSPSHPSPRCAKCDAAAWSWRDGIRYCHYCQTPFPASSPSQDSQEVRALVGRELWKMACEADPDNTFWDWDTPDLLDRHPAREAWMKDADRILALLSQSPKGAAGAAEFWVCFHLGKPTPYISTGSADSLANLREGYEWVRVAAVPSAPKTGLRGADAPGEGDKKCPTCGREMSWGRNTGWVCVVCPFPAPAPGAPQGGDPTAYVSPAFAPLYASEAKRRGAATPSKEEGPAWVDLEAIEKRLDAPDYSGKARAIAEPLIAEVRRLQFAWTELSHEVEYYKARTPAPSPRALPTSEEANRVVDGLLAEQHRQQVSAPIASPRAADLEAATIRMALHLGMSQADPKERGIFEAALEALAHPPKGETPIEAAGLHLEADSLIRANIGFLAAEAELIGLPPTKRHWLWAARDYAKKRGWPAKEISHEAPGTPIEKAAREYVAAARAARQVQGKTLDETIDLDASEDAAWTNLCVAVDGWKPDARASLSSLPQEPAT